MLAGFAGFWQEFMPVGVQPFEELVSVQHIVVGDRRHAHEPISVTLCPVAGVKGDSFLRFRRCAHNGHAQRMTASAASYANDQYTRFFPE
mgnify:CR=1 FL=1